MKKTDLMSLSHGIEAVLSKHRDSLSIEDIYCLEEVNKTLKEIDVSKDHQSTGVLVQVVSQLIRFLMTPGVSEKFQEIFQQINENL